MNIYLVERRGRANYYEYESFVIVCESEEVARNTHPDADNEYRWNGNEWGRDRVDGTWSKDTAWIDPEDVMVELVGTCISTWPRIICSSNIGS